MIIEFDVCGQNIIRKNASDLVELSEGYLYFKFNYDENWANTEKQYRFGHGEETYSAIENIDGLVLVPHEVIAAPYFTVSAGGYGIGSSEGLFIPTNEIKIRVMTGYGDKNAEFEQSGAPDEQITGAMLTLVGEARDLVSQADARIEAALSVAADMEAQEAERNTNENTREENELERQQNEQARAGNELERQQNEQARAASEENRTGRFSVWNEKITQWTERFTEWISQFAIIKNNSVPRIGENENWYIYDAEQDEYIDTGKPSRGENALVNGVHTVSVTAGENISITQNGSGLVVEGIIPVCDVLVNGESVVDEKCASIDLSDYAKREDIPSKLSELDDDSHFAKKDENNNFSSPQTINGNLTVNGDIIQNGSAYQTHTEDVYTKNDIIHTREGALGGLGEGEYTGIEAENYDGEHNGQLVFDNSGTARVGDTGDTQPLLTRAESTDIADGQALVWDAQNARAVGSDEYVKKTDYATIHRPGVIKYMPSGMYGLDQVTGTDDQRVPFSSMSIYCALHTDIDQKTNRYRPIVPSNLDYAVRSVLPETATAVPTTIVPQTEYYLGVTDTLTFTFPQTGRSGQYCFVKFVSGETPTALNVTNYVGEIPTPESNTTYEILANWNGSDWVCQWIAY